MAQVVKTVLVPYSSEEMFVLVDGVESYPQFLPWCTGVTILERSDDWVAARLDFSYLRLRFGFQTRNPKRRPEWLRVELVEGQDLFVKDKFVYMRTTRGPKRVDVIYRRVDDDFLDPNVFRPSSTLGCAGLMDAYKAGHVAICNAVGTGVADDKSIYPYVPDMIKFYLGEVPILKNVPTFQCRKPDDLQYTLANLKDLVVKEVHGAGGYGMLVGPASTQAEIERFRSALLANPEGYIAQPTLSLSTCPTYVDSGIAPRHIDLRPFVLSGRTVQMVPGGLTRVALKEGSLVVNSSQGGGTKDTWILQD